MRNILKYKLSPRIRLGIIFLMFGSGLILLGILLNGDIHKSETRQSMLQEVDLMVQTAWYSFEGASSLEIQVNETFNTISQHNKTSSHIISTPLKYRYDTVRTVPIKDSIACDQNSRQATLAHGCEWASSKGFESAGPWNFRKNHTFHRMFVDDTHKILYCELPKAACTSWKSFFAILSGKVDPDDYEYLPKRVHDTDFYPVYNFKFLSDYSHQERLYRLKHYYKFLIVRNPFTRLVSAYEDKFLHDKGGWYPVNVGEYIIENYRLNASLGGRQNEKDGVSFDELVRFIVNETENMQYRYDPHWHLVQNQCYPCLFDFDYIGKLETMDHDLPYLLDKFTTNGKRPEFPFMNSNPSKQVNIASYYESLSISTRIKLNRYYSIDNRMFGYSMNGNHEECHKS